MAILATSSELAADYRYFVCDVVTNTVLTEIPFSNVTYGRAIREAGTFSGDVPVSPDTNNLSLYENTIPGKTALYVVRNDVCVWGGIIWTRSYDIKNKILNVSADEFTSYLYHRVAWKTWANDYEATVEVVAGTGSAVLLQGSFDFQPNYAVYIKFGTTLDDSRNGYYYVVADPPPTNTTFSFRQEGGRFLTPTDSKGKIGASTVTVRQDTYEFARDLLKSLDTDFFDLRYPNGEIEPSAEFAQIISKVQRSGNIATLTFPQSHNVIPGQRITVKNTNQPGYDGRYLIKDTPTTTTLTYVNTGSNQSVTDVPAVRKTVTSFSRTNSVDTLTTSEPHGFVVGDVVTVIQVNGSVDGVHTISSVPSTTTFSSVSIYASTISASTTSTGYVTRSPEMRFTTYGEFADNSGLLIDYSTQDFSQEQPRPNAYIRGSELNYVGELLEEYSNIEGGFEYRIDCAYNPTTDRFTRTFVFLPLQPTSLTDYINELPDQKLPAGKYAPISTFGADRLVFEHPGNILNATMQESAEDAATRFWVQGDDDTNTEGAALPHAADSDVELLRAGWPILEQVEKIDGITSTDEDVLFNYATRFLTESKPPLSIFSITVDGSIRPVLGSYSPGDWCSVIIDDQFVQLRMQSSLENGSEDPSRQDILLRKIDSFEVRVPDGPSFPEEVTLNLVTELEVDAPGEAEIRLTLLSKTTGSVTLAVLADLGIEETITIRLLRGSTEIKTWSLSNALSLNTSYNDTGLTDNTEYTYSLSGPGGFLSSVTVTTENDET